MKYDIENRVKDTAIINLTDFENAIDLYEDGEIEKALELMFGLAVLGFGGEFETDDREIRRLIRSREYTAVKNNQAYCNRVEAAQANKIAKLQLEEIAEMLGEGVTQQIIADTLEISLSALKYRIGVMKAQYPALYAQSLKSLKTSKKGGFSLNNVNVKDNVNVNVKDNVNVNVKDNVNVNVKDNVNVNVKDNVNVREAEKEKAKEKEVESELMSRYEPFEPSQKTQCRQDRAEGQKKLQELDEETNEEIERLMTKKGYKLYADFQTSEDYIELSNNYASRKKQIYEQYNLS